MKNKTYRFLTLLTTASMLFSGMPVRAAGTEEVSVEAAVEEDETELPEADGDGETITEGDFELYIINSGAKTASISKYNGTGSGALTIPETLGEYSIVKLGSNSFKSTGFNSVTIPATITEMGSYAFAECSELQSVEFAGGGTTITLKDHTFKDCDKLQRISLSERVKEIPESFAYDCDLLTTVEWPAGLTTIGATAFNGNDMLTSSDLSGTALTSIKDSAFSGCKALPLVKLPVNATLTIGDNAFKQTKMSGGTLVIPANVASLGSYAFAECSELQSVEFAAGGTTIALKDHTHTFNNCDKLQRISLSERVKEIPESFAYDCDLLTTVEWPAGLTTIGTRAFNGDEMLTSSDLSGTALTSINDGAFCGCKALPLVKLPVNTTLTIGDNAFKQTKMDGEGGLVIPANVASLGSYAFSDCDGLQSVVFEADEEGSTTISLKDHTFSDCDGLQTITFSSRVVTIPEYFAFGCPKLVQLVDGTAVATVPENGAFTTSKISEIVLTGCNLELENYSWSKDNRVRVDVAVSVSLEEEYTVEEGKTLDLKPVYTVVPEGSKLPDLTWESSSTANVKITGNGVVKGIKEGTAYVTVTRRMAFEDIEKAKVQINVVKKGSGPAPEPEAFVEIPGAKGATDPQPELKESMFNNDSEMLLIKGQKFALGNKDWQSEAKGILNVSKGKATAKGAGTTVMTRGNDKVNVNVVAPVLADDEKKLQLEVGMWKQLSLAGVQADGGMICLADKEGKEHFFPIIFTSSAPDIADVDPYDGTVKPISKGKAVITAYVNGVAFKITVTVIDFQKKSYDFTQEWMMVDLIPMQTITVKARGFKAKNATWASNRTAVPEADLGKGVVFEDDVVRISKNGKITAIGEGVTALTATGGGIDLKFMVSVCGTSERTLHLNVGTPKTVKLYGVKGKPVWTPAGGGETDVVSIDPKGKISGLTAGEVTLETKVEKFTYTLHVFVEDPTVIGEDGKALEGKPGKYNITLTKGERKPVGFASDFLLQTHIFTSNKNNIAYIGTDGLIYARSAGTAKLTTKVNGKKITITVKVNG